MRPFAAALALLAALGGCATRHSFTAEVELPGPVGGECLRVALRTEPDVADVIPTGDASFEFQLSTPGQERKHWPSFSIIERSGPADPGVLSLSTSYETGIFEPDPQARIDRGRAIASAVTEACTGRSPTFGETRPCGAGEPDDLCVTGR